MRDREKEKVIDVDGLGRKLINKVGIKVLGNVIDDKFGKVFWEDDIICWVCGIDEDYDSIFFCDGCDVEYYIYCLVFFLEKVFKGNWFCLFCVVVEEGFLEVFFFGEVELVVL